MGRRRTWTDAMLARLFEMRDVQKMTWEEIGAAFDISAPGAYQRHNYHSTKRRIAEQRTRILAERAEVAPIAAPPSVAACLAEPVKRPRYFHDADADLRGRIARQGLTAGFLGDPPPGRSALDQREAGK